MNPILTQEGHLTRVLLSPRISEKGTYIADKHAQYAFKVANAATKPQIKAAVETLFKVQVERVQVVKVKGKVKRFGGRAGQRKLWKKAYVCLKAGQEIQFVADQ